MNLLLGLIKGQETSHLKAKTHESPRPKSGQEYGIDHCEFVLEGQAVTLLRQLKEVVRRKHPESMEKNKVNQQNEKGDTRTASLKINTSKHPQSS